MSEKYSKQQIFEKLSKILITDFEVDESLLNLDTNLFTDLEFDSIDAVDLAVRLQQFTNKKISPEEFKQIRTLNDVVDAVYDIFAKSYEKN